jgi:hypothetical protein
MATQNAMGICAATPTEVPPTKYWGVGGLTDNQR